MPNNPAAMPNTSAPKWPTQANRNAFYGDPRGANGRVDQKWETANITRVEFPWDCAVLAWDVNTRVKSCRVHRLCAESLKRVLDAIWIASGRSEAKIREWGMHLYGGGYEFRPSRGGTKLSSHAWGCAIDFDPARNAFKDTTPNFANIPQVVDAFRAEGWTWGGPWRPNADGMHFQAAYV